MTQLTVILVTYNSATQIAHCIQTIRAASSIREIVVVDNASSDSSAEIAIQAGAHKVLRNKHNVGFSQAVNQAAAASDGDLILLLNPDCRVDSKTVDEMTRQFRADSKLGVLGPALHNPARTAGAWSAGYFPGLRSSFVHGLGLSRIPHLAKTLRGFQLHPAGEAKSRRTSVDWVSGACLMTTRAQWRDANGLSTRWFMYAEDIDYCVRVQAQGMSVVHDSGLVATHEIGNSSSTKQTNFSSLWLLNLEDLYIQSRDPSSIARFLWRSTWILSMGARGLMFALASIARPTRRDHYLLESRKFLIYAQSMAQGKVSRDEQRRWSGDVNAK